MAAPQKLSQLLQLADQGPALRAALAEEVAELLAAWPPDYPLAMRGACEALLARAARGLDAATRARLQQRLAVMPGLAARLQLCEPGAVVEAVRGGADPADALARHLDMDIALARRILDDESGTMLASACKAAGLGHAAFSALALMARPARAAAMLDAFDRVSQDQAARMFAGPRSAA